MSSKEFLEQCAFHLDINSYNLVALSATAILEPSLRPLNESPFLSSLAAWERSLRNELSRLRARRIQANEDQYLRDSELSSEGMRIAQAAFALEDPLQAELFLERERWMAIESLSALSDFQLDAIFAYRLKLAIAERVAAIQVEAGKEQFARLYDEILGR
ncbi:MAG: hypothetical protein FD137_2015 [Spirochaetes bacterium]|nr:MAG: hypothetical protein FD137_2015 [Spirochaetota bacterium]